jgi:hypothetical protein
MVMTRRGRVVVGFVYAGLLAAAVGALAARPGLVVDAARRTAGFWDLTTGSWALDAVVGLAFAPVLLAALYLLGRPIMWLTEHFDRRDYLAALEAYRRGRHRPSS